jgi:hypothetical protein
MHNQTGIETDNKGGVAQAVTTGALIASAGLAGYGVLGVYGLDTPLAIAGSAAFAGVVILSEVGASRLLVYAQRAIDASRRIGGAAIVAGFAALTVCNVAAGHMGLYALDGAITDSKAAPLVAAHAKAKAEAEAAQEALDAFDRKEDAKATNLAVGLKGAMASGYVSAAARAFKPDAATEAATDAKRDGLQADKAAKKAALDRAATALDAAPQRRPDWQLWAFAGMLELLKGAFQWFAALGAGRAAVQAVAERKGVETVLELSAEDFAALPAEVRREYASKLRSLAASLQHMKPKLAIAN